jgi:hypothetical protein
VGLIAVGVLLLYVWAQRVELKPQVRRMAA